MEINAQIKAEEVLEALSRRIAAWNKLAPRSYDLWEGITKMELDRLRQCDDASMEVRRRLSFLERNIRAYKDSWWSCAVQ